MMSNVGFRRAAAPSVALALFFLGVGSSSAGPAGEGDASDSDAKNQDIERRLEAARGRLENDAREVADLSQQLSGPAMHDVLIGQMFPGRRAILGINIGSRGDLKFDGVYVNGISPGGPADHAGIKAGDVIVALDGKKLMAGGGESADADLMQRLRDVKPGDKVKLQYLRDGKVVNADVTTRAADRHLFAGHDGMGNLWAVPPIPPVPPTPGQFQHFNRFADEGFGDMELVTLTPKLGTYFGTEHGALVVRAPAPDFKLEEGDVITAIDGRAPQSGAHALRILRSYQPGEKVKIAVMRGHKTQTIDATVPAQPRDGGRRFFAAPAAPAAPAAAPVPPRPPADGASDRT